MYEPKEDDKGKNRLLFCIRPGLNLERLCKPLFVLRRVPPSKSRVEDFHFFDSICQSFVISDQIFYPCFCISGIGKVKVF